VVWSGHRRSRRHLVRGQRLDKSHQRAITQPYILTMQAASLVSLCAWEPSTAPWSANTPISFLRFWSGSALAWPAFAACHRAPRPGDHGGGDRLRVSRCCFYEPPRVDAGASLVRGEGGIHDCR